MSCPTCDHTMESIGVTAEGLRYFWCPRCGTLRSKNGMAETGHDEITHPKLVDRCRGFVADFCSGELKDLNEVSHSLNYHGIEEAIHIPSERTQR
jgi:hypothetical protein